MRSAPDAESESILVIHEGLKVDLLDIISGWTKVQLPNGDQGWIPLGVAIEI
jgi:SH3-like domain-containing protein